MTAPNGGYWNTPPNPRKRPPPGHFDGYDAPPDPKLASKIDDEEFTEEDALEGELPGDHTFGGKVVRPAWRKGRYEHLWHKNVNANGGTLTCEICHQRILLTANNPKGLEVYPSNKHYKEQTRPHIDHANPDWVDRYATVQQIIAHANPKFDAKQEKKLLNWAMNAQTLRIVHRACNLAKTKAHGLANSQFQTKAHNKKANWS